MKNTSWPRRAGGAELRLGRIHQAVDLEIGNRASRRERSQR